jgi:hypothetical protein
MQSAPCIPAPSSSPSKLGHPAPVPVFVLQLQPGLCSALLRWPARLLRLGLTAAPATAPRRRRVHTITAIAATTGQDTTTHQHGSRATSGRGGAATEAGKDAFSLAGDWPRDTLKIQPVTTDETDGGSSIADRLRCV